MDSTTTIETAMSPSTPSTWEDRIAHLLGELSQVQGDLLGLLGEKRQALTRGDYESMEGFTRRESALVKRLEACQLHRQQLLAKAADEGLPSESVASLTEALPTEQCVPLRREVTEARRRARLLQHHSLTNWVAVQRTLIHLSQMIEIIATGGRMQPTYGNGVQTQQGGSLVDQSA